MVNAKSALHETPHRDISATGAMCCGFMIGPVRSPANRLCQLVFTGQHDGRRGKLVECGISMNEVGPVAFVQLAGNHDDAQRSSIFAQ